MKQTTGEFLATLRKASGYTQQEVADKLGVSNRTLSSWETDRTAPDLLILPAIADLYGVTVDELLRGERRAAPGRGGEISESAKRNIRKSRFAKYGVNRLFCLGFGLFGGAVFVAACAVLLYSSAPLWLSILLMVLGAGGCAACVILIACFAFSAVRCEGIVLKEDYTEGNKAFVLTVRHGVASTLKLLSLPYISGVIIILITFFAAGYYDNSITVGGITVQVDYLTPTVVCICLNAAFALALFIAGICYSVSGVVKFGSAVQRADLKSNRKLLGKILGFGLIPVAAAFILMAVMSSIPLVKYAKIIYFTANGVDGVRENFQTFKTSDRYSYDDGELVSVIPMGEYYLDFQSEKSVKLVTDKNSGHEEEFYDLGNGFYGNSTLHTNADERWGVYHLKAGKSASDVKEGEYYRDCLHYVDSYEVVYFNSPEGGEISSVNVAYSSLWLDGDFTRLVYNEKDGTYTLAEYSYCAYSELFVIVFWCVAGATAIADTIAYNIKKKRTEYGF